jgi:hypothetical protein
MRWVGGGQTLSSIGATAFMRLSTTKPMSRWFSSPVSSTLDAAITVGADGIIRRIVVTWGTSGSTWVYAVTYGELGSTPMLVAPPDARPLRERLRTQTTQG